MSSFEHIADFKQNISAMGITPPDNIIADGQIHRYGHKKNGWYVFHEGNISGGAFGFWGKVDSQTWSSKQASQFNQVEREAWIKQQADIAAKVKAETLAKQAEAAKKGIYLWGIARSDVDLKHAYLATKGIYPHGVKQLAQALLIPVYGQDKQLTGCQFIYPTGDKRFITGTKKKGSFHCLKPLNFNPEQVPVIYITEGYATGVSVFMAMQGLVFIAFDKGNLKAVAMFVRSKYPLALIVICGDNDADNGGQQAAIEAAQAVNGYVALPVGVKDFNDLHQAQSLEVVKMTIDAAIDSKKAAPSSEEDAAPKTHTSDPIIDDDLHDGEWQDPESIIAHHDNDDYPLDQLPEPLRLLVIELVNYLQCPVAMAVSAVFAALSLCIQGLVNVARDNELIGVVSLFLMVIAESGERKSACDSLVTNHIKEIDKNRLLADMEVLKFHITDMDIWSAERDGLIQSIKQLAKNGESIQNQKEELKQLDQEKPIKPRGTTILYEDTTVEGLNKALYNGCPSAGIFSSEAGIVFGGHGMSSDAAMRNMATHNKYWDGGDVIATRSDISKNMLITGRRLTLSLATQESTVRAFFDGSKGLARGTGFGARFLIAWPKSTQGTRLYKAPPSHWPHKDAFIKRTTELLNTILTIDDETGALQPVTLKFSSKGKEAWIRFYNDTEIELRTGGELSDIKDVTSKAADNVARLAALFHVYEYGITGTISEAHIISAGYVMAWHLMESKRFFSEVVLSKELRHAVLLDNWLIQHCKEHEVSEISTRTIQRTCPNSLREKTIIDDTLKHLADLNRVKIVKDGKKKTILINPKLLGV